MSINQNYSKQENHIIDLSIKERDHRLAHIKDQTSYTYRITVEPLKVLDIFLKSENNWLTVGDYSGVEANYLLQRKQKVTASDISDALLKEAYKDNLITDYSKQNAEHLSFDNDTFDYVMCKEAYHHFPRPYMAMYEMLRVCKKAIIVIGEPIDILSKMSSLVLIKNVLDKINPQLINILWKNRFSYEEVGNYVYKVSEREIEKLAVGMGLPLIAFISLNMNTGSLYNILSSLKIIPRSSLSFVIFKNDPSLELITEMELNKFKLIELPKK